MEVLLPSSDNKNQSEYIDVIEQVARLSDGNYEILQWFKNGNNLTGFVVGVKKSFQTLTEIHQEEFNSLI